MISKLFNDIISDIKLIFRMLKTDGIGPTFRLMMSRDAPGLVQFAKYGICGVIAVVVMIIGTEIASVLLDRPIDHKNNPDVTQEMSEKNLIFCSVLAFMPSNIAAYLLNVLWVFTPGKHSRFKEFMMFTAIATFAFIVGLFGGPILISQGLNPRVAQLGLIVTSALVNYACRKLLIFLK